jgi:hypothetical protein
MRSFLFSLEILVALLLVPGVSLPQTTAQSRYGIDPQRLVAFTFVDTEISEVIRHVVQLTGWSIFYDTAQVHGKVTIITPGNIPLHDALRLVHGVLQRHSHAIRVLTPHSPHALPLAAVLADVTQPPAAPDVVVLHNANARGPYSRPYPCDPQTTYPWPPYWVDVIVPLHK